MTTQAQARALRSRLVQLTAEGTSDIRGVYDLYTPAHIEEIMPALITPILDRASILTAEWYQSLSEKNFRVQEYFPVTEGRINYTTAWANKIAGEAQPVEHMAGAFQRMVFDCSRQTVINNAKREGVPFHRDANEDACPFCRLLTVDPSAHQGKYVDMPAHNHDCRCVAVVSREGNPYTPPEFVEAWKAEAEAKKSGDLTSTLAAMADGPV